MILCEKCGDPIEIKRTLRQNNAMHKFFEMIASEMNGIGREFCFQIVNERSIPYTSEIVKAFIWKPLQKLITGKERTRDLTTEEVSKVAELIEKTLWEKFQIGVAFPHIDFDEMKQILES